MLSGDEVEEYLREQFASLGGVQPDCVVLGCTHFPFVRGAIQNVLGADVKLFDGGEGTARQMKRRLAECGLSADEGRKGSVTIINSAGTEEMLRLSRMLLEVQHEF